MLFLPSAESSNAGAKCPLRPLPCAKRRGGSGRGSFLLLRLRRGDALSGATSRATPPQPSPSPAVKGRGQEQFTSEASEPSGAQAARLRPLPCAKRRGGSGRGAFALGLRRGDALSGATSRATPPQPSPLPAAKGRGQKQPPNGASEPSGSQPARLRSLPCAKRRGGSGRGAFALGLRRGDALSGATSRATPPQPSPSPAVKGRG